jgi:hypothetical protein
MEGQEKRRNLLSISQCHALYFLLRQRLDSDQGQLSPILHVTSIQRKSRYCYEKTYIAVIAGSGKVLLRKAH